MNKRLLSAATAIALCALAAPAHARSYEDHRGPDRDFYDFRWDRLGGSKQGEDGGASSEREPSHRAARPSSRSQARPNRNATVKVRKVVTQPVAVLPPDAAKPDAPAPAQKLAAATPQNGTMPDLKPLVPFVEPAQPKHAAKDGRTCLKPAARALLERIEAEFGPMQIISTCRPGARIAGSGRISKHATGEAIDFNAGKRKADVVRWLIANHKTGGTMTYAGMGHVHVDVGYHFVALNSGGRRRR
jgi:hypothetical protein